jgi:hypothetical protein
LPELLSKVARDDQILVDDSLMSLEKEKLRYLAETSTHHLRMPFSQSVRETSVEKVAKHWSLYLDIEISNPYSMHL